MYYKVIMAITHCWINTSISFLSRITVNVGKNIEIEIT